MIGLSSCGITGNRSAGRFCALHLDLWASVLMKRSIGDRKIFGHCLMCFSDPRRYLNKCSWDIAHKSSEIFWDSG